MDVSSAAWTGLPEDRLSHLRPSRKPANLGSATGIPGAGVAPLRAGSFPAKYPKNLGAGVFSRYSLGDRKGIGAPDAGGPVTGVTVEGPQPPITKRKRT